MVDDHVSPLTWQDLGSIYIYIYFKQIRFNFQPINQTYPSVRKTNQKDVKQQCQPVPEASFNRHSLCHMCCMSMFQRFFFCRDGKADQTAKIQSCGCENCAITPIEALGYFSICFRFFQIHLSLFNHRIPANLCKSPKLNIYSTVFVQCRMVHKGYPCSPSFSTEDGKDNPSCAAYTPVWVHLQNHPLGMAMDNTLIQSPIQYSCKISSSHCSATSTAILNGVYSIHTKRMEYSIMCPISFQFCGASTGFTSITINHPIRTC